MDTMPDIHKTIVRELKRQKKTAYWLSQQKGVTCHLSTVGKYIRGDNDMGGEYIGQLMDALGLTVKRKD